MAANYDSTLVGNPYVDVQTLTLSWPDNSGHPSAVVSQVLAVKLLDGTTRYLGAMSQLNPTLDFANHGNDPIPLVDPVTGAATGGTTTLNQVFAGVLAVIRSVQVASGQ